MVNNLNRGCGVLYSIRPSKNHEKSPIFTVRPPAATSNTAACGRKSPISPEVGMILLSSWIIVICSPDDVFEEAVKGV
jgi:hypothetical protein